jgi:hypothetical protein
VEAGVNRRLVRRLVERTAETFDLPFKLTPLQELQADLRDVIARAHQADEETARSFLDYLIALAAREGARGR